MIVYIENPTDSTKKLLDLISEFGKTVGYQVNIQKAKGHQGTCTKDPRTKAKAVVLKV